MSAQYFLGIDGGQSSTIALIGDQNGWVSGAGRSGPCNHVGAAEGRAKFVSTIRACVGAACGQAGLDVAATRFATACLGFSGGPSDKEAILQEILLVDRMTVTDDALIALSGALAGEGGEVLGAREDAHVGADLGDDAFGAAPLNAGDRAEQLNGRGERADLLLDRLREPVDLLVEEVDVGEDRPDPGRVQPVEAALERLLERGQLLAQAALANSASTCGSVVPAISASSIARPEAPRMSVATQSSLIPVSSSALCSRFASRERSWICALR